MQKSKLLTIRVMHLFMNVSYFLAAICFSGENPNVHAWGDVFAIGVNTMVRIIMARFPKLSVRYLGIEITTHITKALCYVSFLLHF